MDIPHKPPLHPSKPTLHSMHEIDDSLKDLTSYLSLRYSDSPSSTLSPPPSVTFDDFTDLPGSSHPLPPPAFTPSSSIPSPNHRATTPHFLSSTPTESALLDTKQYYQKDTPKMNHLETISNRENKIHQDHISETQETSMRLITLKEQEIARLSTRLKEAENMIKEKEGQIADSAKEISKAHMMQQIEMENMKTQQVKYYETKVAELTKRFHDELKTQHETHKKALEESEILWKKKLQAIELNRDALVDTLQNKDIEIEQNWDTKLKSVHGDYRNQLMQLHELLNAESTRLSDAREEINQLTNARKSDLVTLKGKLQTLLNIMEQKDKEYATNVKFLKDQFTSKEEDYKTQIRNLRSTQQIEVDHFQKMMQQLEGKILAEEQNWVGMEEEYKKREMTSHEFILSLQKEIRDIRQASAQRDTEWRFWGQRCHKLETENAIIRNELSLLESEGRRLREVSILINTRRREKRGISRRGELYEGELAHLDNIVYGSRKNNVSKASRQFRVSK